MKIFKGQITTLIAVFFFSISCYATDSKDHIDLEKDEKVLERVKRHEQGDYGDMNRGDAVSPLGDIQEAWDKADEKAGVVHTKYDPHKVIKLSLRQQTVTTVIFPEWEEIDDIYLGDSVVFEAYKTKKNVLVLYSKYAGADTSLTVMGEISKNPYTFYLRSVGIHAKNISDFTVFVDAVPSLKRGEAHNREDKAQSLSGPLSLLKSREGEVEITHLDKESAMELVRIGSGRQGGYENPDFLEEIEIKKENLDFNYTMHGDKEIAPKYVFNDGLFTYLYYGEKWDGTDIPVVQKVVDQIDRPINQRVKRKMIVVESLGNFTLKNGRRLTCVKQKGA